MQLFGMPLQKYHPFSQLLLLVGMGVFLGSIFGSMGLVLASFLTNVPLTTNLESLNLGEHIRFFQIAQSFATFGAFLLPALLLNKMLGELNPPTDLLLPVRLWHWVLVPILIISVTPLVYLLYDWNQNLSLPDWLASLETWMLAKEQSAKTLTEAILAMKTPTDLALNLVVVAVFPAIAEEVLFRGWIQTLLFRWFRKKHLAIWLTAILFSAFHMQFYGFLPRLFLGALFGYLFLYTGNMALVVLAHFLNNALAVLAAYGEQHWGWPTDNIFIENHHWVFSGFALVTIIGIIAVLHRNRNINMPFVLLPTSNNGNKLD